MRFLCNSFIVETCFPRKENRFIVATFPFPIPSLLEVTFPTSIYFPFFFKIVEFMVFMKKCNIHIEIKTLARKLAAVGLW